MVNYEDTDKGDNVMLEEKDVSQLGGSIWDEDRCPICGLPLEEDWRHCPACGKDMGIKDLSVLPLNYLEQDYVRYEGEVTCPFCGADSGFVKTNGRGFYRCKGECESKFFLMRCTE